MKKNEGHRKPDAQEMEIVRNYEHSGRNSYFDAEEIELIIDYYLEQDDLQSALSALRLGRSLHPTSQELKLREVQLLFALESYDKALQLLDTDVENNDPDALFWRGNILVQQGNIDLALAVYDQLLEQEKGDEFFDDLCFDIARTFKDESNLRYGIPFLEMGYYFNPRNFDLLNHYALSCTLLSQFDMAIKLINELIDLDVFNQNSWFQLAEIYYCTENYTDALQAIEYTILLDKTDGIAWRQKGRILYDLKSYRDAINCFSQSLDLMSKIEEKSDLYASIGECYEQMQEYEKALEFYQKSINLDNCSQILEPDVYIGSAFCLLQAEQYEKCEEFALGAIVKFPEISELYVYYADACVNQNKFEEAEQAYRQSLALNENQPSIYLSLGNLYLEKFDFESALICYLRAYELDSKLENIALFLSLAYYRLGIQNEARHFFAMAYAVSADAQQMFLEYCPEGTSFVDEFLKSITSEE